MYMSYCRFEGTMTEMDTCLSEVQDHLDGNAEYVVSAREIDCFRSTVNRFFNFLQEAGIIDWDVELDSDALDEVCESMRQSFK